MKKIFFVLLALTLISTAVWPLTSQAVTATCGGLLQGITPSCCECGNCGTCDIIKIGTNVADLLVGLAGAVAILMFVIGGTLMIVDYGSGKNIQKGKEVVKATIYGLVIVFCAWTIVNTVIAAFYGGTINESAFGKVTSAVTGGKWNICEGSTSVKSCGYDQQSILNKPATPAAPTTNP